MANRKQKLELTWNGKESQPKLGPRVLLEDRRNHTMRHTESSTCLSEHRQATTCSEIGLDSNATEELIGL